MDSESAIERVGRQETLRPPREFARHHTQRSRPEGPNKVGRHLDPSRLGASVAILLALSEIFPPRSTSQEVNRRTLASRCGRAAMLAAAHYHPGRKASTRDAGVWNSKA